MPGFLFYRKRLKKEKKDISVSKTEEEEKEAKPEVFNQSSVSKKYHEGPVSWDPSQNDLYLSSRRSGRHGPPDVLQSRLGGDHVPRRRVPAGTGNRMNGLRPGRIQPVHYVLESNGTIGKMQG